MSTHRPVIYVLNNCNNIPYTECTVLNMYLITDGNDQYVYVLYIYIRGQEFRTGRSCAAGMIAAMM